tara:strand:+ start:7680 stop:8267 length:588 start_codon:yes stop_codon:yes gene_type:complete
MSLYGRTDSNANKTKAGIGVAASAQAKTIVFVDETEAALAQNKSRGINAPGWWSYFTYNDSSGATRHKAEHLITLANADTNANETQSDDTIAGDAASSVAIGTQPAAATVAANGSNTATFTVAATKTGAGSLTYQWQLSTNSGVDFADISGATATSYETAAVVAGDSGNQYRVKVNTTAGAVEVVSSAATLTVTE